MEKITEIDIIILSYAKDEALKEVTEKAVKSLNKSEIGRPIKFNTIIIESEKALSPYQYPNSKTIYPKKKFGYHKYMNIGIEMTKSSYVCICNNDLIFHENWASEILKAFKSNTDVVSASPACSIHHPSHDIQLYSGNHFGYEVRKELVGWCLFFKRSMLKKTGMLDPNYKFWYADNDYSNTLKKHGLKHFLVTSSIVDHMESRTLNTKSEEEQRKLTQRERFYYEYKWEGRSYFSYLNRLRKFK
ncbi:hypothetical protein GCM10028791_19970 [Echinicola sediminis]